MLDELINSTSLIRGEVHIRQASRLAASGTLANSRPEQPNLKVRPPTTNNAPSRPRITSTHHSEQAIALETPQNGRVRRIGILDGLGGAAAVGRLCLRMQAGKDSRPLSSAKAWGWEI